MNTMFFNPDGLHIIEMVCAGLALVPGLLSSKDLEDDSWDEQLVESFPHLEN